jgi:hypothetical protein
MSMMPTPLLARELNLVVYGSPAQALEVAGFKVVIAKES